VKFGLADTDDYIVAKLYDSMRIRLTTEIGSVMTYEFTYQTTCGDYSYVNYLSQVNVLNEFVLTGERPTILFSPKIETNFGSCAVSEY